MVWAFSGNLKQGTVTSQYPNLHQTCVNEANNDDPVWEQFAKATNEHADRIETLRTASAHAATALLRSSIYQQAFGDLVYAVHCIEANIAVCLDGASDEDMNLADEQEVAKIRELQRNCSTFVELVTERFNKEENGRGVEDWVKTTICGLTQIALQVVAMFSRLSQHDQEMGKLMRQCTASFKSLAETLKEKLLAPATTTAT